MKDTQESKRHQEREALPSGSQGARLDQALGDIGSKMLKQGMAPKEALGVSDSRLEGVYAQAYRLYNTGKYAEAAHLFRILIMLNAMEPKYVLGLAATFHMLREYQNAIQSYTMHAALDPRTPIPHYHSADCFMQMKDYLSAMLCLELAVERTEGKPEYAKLRERALLNLESLKKRIHSQSEEQKKLAADFEPGQLDLF